MQLENVNINYYHKRLIDNNFINVTESLNYASQNKYQANQNLASLRVNAQKENYDISK